MRLNENTVVYGDKVVLVPYRHEHVLRYHEWMRSPELLELTASEPLSLDAEYEMQRKWHLDDDKLTFILLERPAGLAVPLDTEALKSARMVGDVNLFLHNGPADNVECEIMIAHADDRRRGFAREALTLFLSYATLSLRIPPAHLIARIGAKNAPSIALFERLGFRVTKLVAVWDEVEMRFGAKGGPDNGENEAGDGVAGDGVAVDGPGTADEQGANVARFLGAEELAPRIGTYD
ncbi:hypothetical protein Q5752_005159 [Cryptotrichosporon argae]